MIEIHVDIHSFNEGEPPVPFVRAGRMRASRMDDLCDVSGRTEYFDFGPFYRKLEMDPE